MDSFRMREFYLMIENSAEIHHLQQISSLQAEGLKLN
jgi:hypothetical protein